MNKYRASAALISILMTMAWSQANVKKSSARSEENRPKSEAWPSDQVKTLRQRYEKHLGRYITPCMHLDSNPYPRWQDFSQDLMKCDYTQDDRKGRKGPIIGHKKATAITLDPSIDVLASWVVATCLIVKHNANQTCTDGLMNQILNASNAHFVIAGVVLEDQWPCPDGKHCGNGIIESYNFRDGVTVSIKGGLKNFSETQASDPQILKALAPDSTITAAHKYARIQSTCREHYQAYEKAMGREPENVKGLNWLTVVRALYQDAWRRAHDVSLTESVEKYRNELMIAWEMEHSKIPDGQCT